MTGTMSRGLDWVLRGLLVVLFTIAGAMKLTAHPFELHGFAHFGYPLWFMYAIGAIEFAAGFALLQARLLMPAVAVLGVVLLGAVASHLRVGDPPAMALPAVVALAMLAGLAVLHRRRSRALA
ncbi:DoxX family protein [Falsiroseomonas selenitidurans]|uniref:DoxX family protein n=1 Tax=Falsiroseomonas selenitidurans TaxID=2716335 RepID=A0ABX1E2A6_9PROT|nr:DoxX family protein [Falsiroseomonas selenitidurans]NKC31289.1 DoxX family protein [Falsiroseomonas selenitidurans]